MFCVSTCEYYCFNVFKHFVKINLIYVIYILESQVHQETLHTWLKTQVEPYDSISVEDLAKSFKNGLALCAVIHRYRPDLVDFFSLSPSDVAKNNQLAFDILEHEFGITPVRFYAVYIGSCTLID